MTRKYHSLNRSIILSFCIFAVLVSGVFVFSSFILMYIVEDNFFENTIQKEYRILSEQYRSTGILPSPRLPTMQVVDNVEMLPDDVRHKLKRNPGARELSGMEGRHYHLAYAEEKPEFILVWEVSQALIVRPIRESVLTFYSLAAFTMCILGCAIGYYLARRATAPLTKLVGLVEHSSPERLPAEFSKQFPDNEVGVLAKTLGKALLRIRQFVDREQQFTRDVSHELRTPITVVKGAIEILDGYSNRLPESKMPVERISYATMKMEQTVNILLSLAREETDIIPKTPVRILRAIENTIVQHAALLDNKNVDVKIQVPAQYEVKLANGVLDIILDNLIGNAFHHTKEGEIGIVLAHEKLTISNSGAEIEADIIQDICKPLVKGRGSKGLGLGLSIVKRLCERHGIDLQVHSENSLTCVTVDLSEVM